MKKIALRHHCVGDDTRNPWSDRTIGGTIKRTGRIDHIGGRQSHGLHEGDENRLHGRSSRYQDYL